MRADALKAAQDAGAIGIQLSARRNVRTADIEARKLFIEAEITVEASGRPRVAS